jgi:excisionase family DNA binding protein
MSFPNPFEVICNDLNELKAQVQELTALVKKQPIQAERSVQLTRKQLAEEYKISLPTLHNYMKSGKLPFRKVGKKTLFLRTDVEQFFSGFRNE